MKFLLNCSINTLPTRSNLKQWGYTGNDKCPHCKEKETTNHILNCCPHFLQQGRYTWRHNCVVNFLLSIVDKKRFEVHADLPGHEAPGGGTVPCDILVTAERPDIVVIDRFMSTVTLIEVTVPFETRLEVSRQIKMNKYAHLESDLRETGWMVDAYPVEIGSRGLINEDNKYTLSKILNLTSTNMKLKDLMKSISKITVLSTFKVFLARKNKEWINPDFILP